MSAPFEILPPAAEMTTYFVVYDDGATGRIETTGTEPPQLARAGTLVSESRYQARLVQIQEEYARYVHELKEADEERIRHDFEALAALGIPAETAGRLTGYVLPGPDDDLPDLSEQDSEQG